MPFAHTRGCGSGFSEAPELRDIRKLRIAGECPPQRQGAHIAAGPINIDSSIWARTRDLRIKQFGAGIIQRPPCGRGCGWSAPMSCMAHDGHFNLPQGWRTVAFAGARRAHGAAGDSWRDCECRAILLQLQCRAAGIICAGNNGSHAMWIRETVTIRGHRVTAWSTAVSNGQFQALFTVFPPVGAQVFFERLPSSLFDSPHAARQDVFRLAEDVLRADRDSVGQHCCPRESGDLPVQTERGSLPSRSCASET